MEPRYYSTMSSQIYISLWNKYRPVIIHLMRATEAGPQEYKLFDHEFRALNPKEKKGYAFTLTVVDGKAANNIKNSATAQDLLYILTNSRKASELMDENNFEFVLDKQLVLHVTRLAEPEEVDTPE